MDIINEILKETDFLKSLEESRKTNGSAKVTKPVISVNEASKKSTKKSSDAELDGSTMGLVLNELINRIKSVEDNVEKLQGNVKSAIQENTNYKFAIKRDDKGRITSVTASAKDN